MINNIWHWILTSILQQHNLAPTRINTSAVCKSFIYSNVLQCSHHNQPPFATESTVLYADHLLMWKSYVVDESIILFTLNGRAFDIYEHHDPAIEWNIEENGLIQIINHAVQAQNSQYSFTAFLRQRYGSNILEQFAWYTRDANIFKFRKTIIQQVLMHPPVKVEIWMYFLRFQVLRRRRCLVDLNLKREQL